MSLTKSIKEWVLSEGIRVINKVGEDKKNEMIIMLEEYEKNEKPKKAKRARNVVEEEYRCKAKRADGTQCSRRKLEKEELCGTHKKGQPHGLYEKKEEEGVGVGIEENKLKKIVLKIEDIGGIMNYIDEEGYIYNQEDIKMNKSNVRRIGRV